jgi:hypothetical protein
MQMEKAPSRRRKALHFGAVVGVTAAAVLSTANPSWAAADVATINPVSGTASTAVQMTMTVATQSAAANSFISGSTFVTFETAGTCPTTHTAPGTIKDTTAAANVVVLSPTKLAFPTPATLTTGGGGPTYSVCAYNEAGGALLAKANAGYTVGALPTIVSWSPKAASTQGGGTIVVTGTNLDTTTATLGGVAVGSWTPIGTTMATGTIPANGVGAVPLIVTRTGGGTATQAAAFTYANGVTVTPNYGSNSRTRTDISVTGSNLAGITFNTTTGATPGDTGGHVYLAKGVYDPTKSGLVKANGEAAECLNVVPISNTELVCSLYLSGAGGVPMNASRTVSATVTGNTMTAALGNFGPGDVGQTVTGSTSLGTNTYITSVIDPTRVTLSKAATAAITTAANLTLNPARSITDITFASGGTAITSAAGAQFSSADIGRVISGTGVSGQTITAVTSPTTATISSASSAASSGPYVLTASKASLPPVPVGTYTVTVVNNGALDANTSPSFYSSVISSGSTFTVAEF